MTHVVPCTASLCKAQFNCIIRPIAVELERRSRTDTQNSRFLPMESKTNNVKIQKKVSINSLPIPYCTQNNLGLYAGGVALSSVDVAFSPVDVAFLPVDVAPSPVGVVIPPVDVRPSPFDVAFLPVDVPFPLVGNSTAEYASVCVAFGFPGLE